MLKACHVILLWHLQHTKLNPVNILNKQRFVNATFNILLLFVISDALFFYVLLIYFSVFYTIFGCQLTSFASVVSVYNFPHYSLFISPAFINWSFPFSSFPLMSSALVMGAPNDSCSSTGTCLSVYLPISVFCRRAGFFSWVVYFTHVFCVTSYVCTLWHFVFPFCFFSV